MIKLIASDLDGTLLTDSKELSQTTVQILDMAVKKGIYVIPATGRSFRAIPEQIRNYPGIRYVINPMEAPFILSWRIRGFISVC